MSLLTSHTYEVETIKAGQIMKRINAETLGKIGRNRQRKTSSNKDVMVLRDWDSVSAFVQRVAADGKYTLKEQTSASWQLKPTDYRLKAMAEQVLTRKDSQLYSAKLFGGLDTHLGTDAPVEFNGDVGLESTQQGSLGSCAPLAALLGSFTTGVNHWVNPNGTHTFKLWSQSHIGKEVYVTVKPERHWNGSKGFGGVVEKAYQEYLELERYRNLPISQRSNAAHDDLNNGASPNEPLLALTGRDVTSVAARHVETVAGALSGGKAVIYYQANTREGIQGLHAYRVLGVDTNSGSVTLHNPWNVDAVFTGGVQGKQVTANTKALDGVFTFAL